MFGLTELQIINIAAVYSDYDGVSPKTAINSDRVKEIAKELKEHAEDQEMDFIDYVDQVAKQS